MVGMRIPGRAERNMRLVEDSEFRRVELTYIGERTVGIDARICFLAAIVIASVMGMNVANVDDKKPEVENGKATAPETKKSGDSGSEPKIQLIPPPGAPTAEQLAEWEAWMNAATTGPEHSRLSYMVGTWDVSVKWYRSPTEPPQESKGVSRAEWMLGDRFVKYSFAGDFGGEPFEGFGFTGYDNIAEKYVSIWADTMMTGVLIDSGTYDPDSKTYTYRGEFKEPSGKAVKTRSTIKVESQDRHVLSIHHTGADGKELQVMEMTYQRAKPESVK